eukprot:493414-Hanusia_phi.AAC.1
MMRSQQTRSFFAHIRGQELTSAESLQLKRLLPQTSKSLPPSRPIASSLHKCGCCDMSGARC